MFGLNNAQLIGRLGADATISHLTNGGRVANVSIATDESYLDRNSGDKVDRTEWHRIVTFQDGLVEMMEKHAKKGRLVYVSGKLQTRKWRKDGEDSDRFSTEILLVPGGRVQFLDKPNGNGTPSMNGDTVPSARDRRDDGGQQDPLLGRFPPPVWSMAGSRQIGVGPAIFYAALFEFRKSVPYRDLWANAPQTAFDTAMRNAALPQS